VGDQVAGVGDTAVAAERLGRRNRLRERLAVYFVEPEGGQPLSLPEQLIQLQSIFQSHDRPIHLVGGAVRDVLLGRSMKDLDFVVPGGAVRLAFRVANSLNLPAYVLDRERDAGRVVLPDGETTLDFTCYRGEDLLSDLRNRDFTINAIALPVAARTRASLIDPCDGLTDMKAGLIRQTHPAAIEDDPVRAMRAVRHAVDFDFTITDETCDAVRGAAALLDGVSIERVRDELLKMMRSRAPEKAFYLLEDLSLLPSVLPEIAALADIPQTPPHYESVLAHTGSVLRWISQVEELVTLEEPPAEQMLAEAHQCLAPYRQELVQHIGRRLDGGVSGRQVLRLGALFHDVGKAETMTVEANGRIRFLGHAEVGAVTAAKRLSDLRLSREVVRHEKALIAGHMRPLYLAQNPKLSRRAIFRFFRDCGSAGLDITLLALADHLAVYHSGQVEPQWRRLLDVVSKLHEHYFTRFNETVQPEALLDGRSLIEILSIEPGPEIGRLLGLLVEAQAAGEIETREQAITLIKALAAGSND
jgi:putative nucleotidyltransferase with HDIG domain